MLGRNPVLLSAAVIGGVNAAGYVYTAATHSHKVTDACGTGAFVASAAVTCFGQLPFLRRSTRDAMFAPVRRELSKSPCLIGFLRRLSAAFVKNHRAAFPKQVASSPLVHIRDAISATDAVPLPASSSQTIDPRRRGGSLGHQVVITPGADMRS
eukprot:2611874-Rhodomonas_salina.1